MKERHQISIVDKKRPKRKIMLYSVFVFTLMVLTVFIMLTRLPNLYRENKEVIVSINGITSPNSAVYNLHDNEIMIHLVKSPISEVYILDIVDEIVRQPPGNDAGLYFMLGYVYCPHGVPPTIPLNGTSSKMDNFNAGLVIRKEYYEFRTLSGDLIHVTLPF